LAQPDLMSEDQVGQDKNSQPGTDVTIPRDTDQERQGNNWPNQDLMSEDQGGQDKNGQPGTDVTRPRDTDQERQDNNGPTKI
jgi:hypothetical protein